MARLANYSTDVPVKTTVDTVQKMLGAAGVNTVTTEWSAADRISGITFSMRTEMGWMPFRLPVRTEAVYAALRADKTLKPSQRTEAHAERVAWRIAHDWLRANLALVHAGMATVAEVMLPYALIGPEQETAYEVMIRQRALGAKS